MQKKLKNYFKNKLNQLFIIESLQDSGLAHWHYRIQGENKLVRVPKQSQMGLSPTKNLEYEAACYQVCQPSQITPSFFETIEVNQDFPMGGLIIEEIQGRSIQLKKDILKVAKTLAQLHQLPISKTEDILFRPAHPIQAMLEEVKTQSEYLHQSNQGKKIEKLVMQQFEQVKKNLNQIDLQQVPLSLISFDCHPANYIINQDDQAILVDLEKCRYSYAGFDLAHASIYTSTTWGQTSNFDTFTLSTDEVIQFYQTWLKELPKEFAQNSIPILLDLRILMWLWAVTWSSKWLVESQKEKKKLEQGQNWSIELSEQQLVDTVAINVHDYLQESTIEKIIATWDANSELTHFFKNY